MRILAIETSCDETAIAILDCSGDEKSANFRVLGNALLSQADKHKEYGGVFPALAKREHAKNLVPILEAALEEAELLREDTQSVGEETRAKISEILAREVDLTEKFFEFISECEPPKVDAIAVTAGPGLEPALWVGINFARALSVAWNIPVVSINHMEGHILAGLAREAGEGFVISNLQFPILALLISGGHTELILMRDWLRHELIGRTRDDAVGEAYDKVARMLGLPYPGGPEISRLAESARNQDVGFTKSYILPRPMINDGTCDFSFAGLKTAVLYLLKERTELSGDEKKHLAREFEDAVGEVLWKKTAFALESTKARTLVIGGGVSANTHIKRTFTENVGKTFPEVALSMPSIPLSTDNAVMIAFAGYFRASNKDFTDLENLKADGNAHLA